MWSALWQDVADYLAAIGYHRQGKAMIDTEPCTNCGTQWETQWSQAFDKWLCMPCRIRETDRLLDGPGEDMIRECAGIDPENDGESDAARVLRENRQRQRDRYTMENAHGQCAVCGSPLVVDLIDVTDVFDVVRRVIPARMHCRHDYQGTPSRTRLLGGPWDGHELSRVPTSEAICAPHPRPVQLQDGPTIYSAVSGSISDTPVATYRRDRPHGDLMLYRYAGSTGGDDAA